MIENPPTLSALNPAWSMECSLVGALLLAPDEFPESLSIVKPEDLAYEPARLVYDAMRFLARGGIPIDEVLLARELKQRGQLDAVGGATGLDSFTDTAGSGANAKFYAASVAKAARERGQGMAVAKAYQALSAEECDHDGVCADLMAELQAAKNSESRNNEAQLAGDILTKCLDENRASSFLTTGYSRFDTLLGGGPAIPSLTAIAAGPSIGKSQLALNMATQLRRDGERAKVLYVSAEMGETETMCRLVAMRGDMHLGTVKTIMYGRAHGSTLDAYGWRFEQAAARVKELPLRMVFGSFDADGLRDIATRYSGRFDAMFVDYLQRIGGKSGQKTLERVSAASQACRDIANQHAAAVIIISSLNREGYRDRNIKPDLPHLRESGDIEFDCDNILTLWREKAPGVTRETLELFIRKQRNGPLDVVNFEFDLPVGRIWEGRNDF